MNTKLINALKQGMTQDSRKEVLHLINISRPDDRIWDLLSQQDLVKCINLACCYVAEAIDNSQDGTWELLVGGAELTHGLEALMKNPATVNFAQAMMIIVYAILKGDDK